MLDIGQGESIFIEFPNHKTMLIDGGGFYKNSLDVGKMVIAPFILGKSLGQIDYMIATHSDNDHISGLESILDIIKTENISMPIVPKLAATKPRPPSKNPKANPCFSTPPQIRVAFIIGAQNRKIVVKPQ